MTVRGGPPRHEWCGCEDDRRSVPGDLGGETTERAASAVEDGLHTRSYGHSGPLVVVLPGRPAAAGSMAPVARGLADAFRVLEPFQRGSGPEPLTAARHVADLARLIEREREHARPTLVGHSWGAMLALAHAAVHPESVSALVLVGCGTFDPRSRQRMREILEERVDAGLHARRERIERETSDLNERLRAKAELVRAISSVDLLPDATGAEDDETFDARAHDETWNDMLRCQEAGIYPAAFTAARAPVPMLHGACDPHPGRRIRNTLRRQMPQLEYREWRRCGHEP